MNIDKMYLPPQVEFVLNRLSSLGFEAYAVGGCVRDNLLGKTPTDYDVTTDAKPEMILSAFSDSRVIETGLKHGTVTVLRDGMSVEVTTYRIDGKYADCRHPDKVTFTTDLREDLCRRDFTVNAMAYEPKKGIIDCFGGRKNLKNGIIRCVGSAEERFSEDGLRILRALRFASALDFTLDEECANAVRNLKSLLGKISRERICTELTKLLLGEGAARILDGFGEVIASALPGMTAEKVKFSASCIKNSPKNIEIRYAILFSELDESEAKAAVNSLKMSNSLTRAIMSLIQHKKDTFYLKSEYDLLRLLNKTDDDFPIKLARYQASLGILDFIRAGDVKNAIDKLRSGDKIWRVKDLKLDGKDMISLGLRGAEIGNTLEDMLDMVMRGKLTNDREELIKYIKDKHIV